MPSAAKTKSGSTLAGTLTRKMYHEGGFLIGKLDTGDTVVGNILEPLEGQEYKFEGEWGEHPKFGRQFKFSRYTSCLPQTNAGIARYLSRVAKWVDTVRARKIVDLYGKDTLKVLKEDPEQVAKDIRGITLARAQEIQQFLVQNEALEAAIVQIEEIISRVRGLPTGLAMQIIKRFGSDGPTKIKIDPYILTEFNRVGFKLADSVALMNDYPKDGVHRKAAAIYYVLEMAGSNQGHTCLTISETAMRAENLIGYNPETGFQHLAGQDQIGYPDKDHVALATLHNDEISIAGIVRLFLESSLTAPIDIPSDGLEDDQIEAAKLIGRNRFSILTGPPGSGKTYLLARIVKALRVAGYSNVTLCAPTGKAAARMTESLQDVLPDARAYTIHKTLGPEKDPETGDFIFRHGRDFPLHCHALIVDETSMLDTSLAARLLEATTTDMVIIFVGDHYQLPSVGPGAVLKDLSTAGVPTARLEKIKRNAGRIVRACHTIKDGKMPRWSTTVDIEAGENFRHIFKKSGPDIIQAIVNIATKKVPEMGLDPVWDFQALSPMNERSDVSCKAINEAMAMALNPGRETIKGLFFRIGDKVVRTRNEIVPGRYGDKFDPKWDGKIPDGDLDFVEIVNGDLGTVLAVERNDEKKWRVIVHLRNPDRIVYLPKNEHHLRQAYCMTIHKMQGSDAPIIVIPLHKSVGSFPTREMIYTAISRAKTLCLTIGDQSVARKMIDRIAARRTTKLVERIQGKI